MKKTTIYWILLAGVLIGISYLYASWNTYDEPVIYSKDSKLFNAIEIGDFFVLKDTANQVYDFFKVVGNPKSDSIWIAYGNPTYNNNFKNKDWVKKGIDRPIYFQSELKKVAKYAILNIHLQTSNFKVYRQDYPLDQFPLSLRLYYSPLGLLLIIVVIFLIIWLVDTSSFYLSSRFQWLSRIMAIGILSYAIVLIYYRIQYQGYIYYLMTQGLAIPSFWVSSWANSIIEFLPIFLSFQYLKNRYFKQLNFADQEFSKFLCILVLGTLLQLVAVIIIFWIVPKFGIPAINYYQLDQMGYSILIKEFSLFWAVIAIANFLNNLRKYVKELGRKSKLLNQSEEKELASQSELDALQARVNPHFLYNSLNSIASLAQVNPAKTEEMTIALSDFYKHSTNRADKYWSTIGEESQLLRTYLDIEKIRFGERLEYELEIAESLKNQPIPHFLLQPLVENAIKYGFDKDRNTIAIVIKAEIIGDQLHIKVKDSGDPFSEQLSTGYGLRSVKKKLKLLYPKMYEIHFINTPKKQIHIILKSLNKLTYA